MISFLGMPRIGSGQVRRLRSFLFIYRWIRKFTKTAQATGSKNAGPERTLLGLLATGAVNSPIRITLENNGTIRPQPQRANTFARASGAENAADVESSPLRKFLLRCWNFSWRWCGQKIRTANAGPKRFHQNRTVSWQISTPCTCGRSSTLRRENVNRTHSIAARRTISGDILKYRNGPRWVM